MLFEKPRKDFLDLLKSCRHGLSTRDVIPALACFCFYKNEVISFDDVVAVVAPCDVGGFTGGFRGGLLMKWLETTKAKEVKLVEHKESGSMEWRAGRSRLKMEVLPGKEFVFSIPRHDGDTVAIPDFREFLQAAAVSMGTDPSSPWRLGVTLSFGGDGITLFSTDNLSVTAVFAEYDIPKDLQGKQVILVPRLVEVVLSGKEPPTHLAVINKSTIRFDYESGRKVFCRLSTDVDCRKFHKVMSMVPWEKGAWCQIPDRLERILDQMNVVLKTAEEPLCSFAVDDEGTLSIKAKGGGSELSDWVQLKTEEDEEHPPVTVRLNPQILKRSIEFCEEIKITDKWVAVRVDDQVQVVVSIFSD